MTNDRKCRDQRVPADERARTIVVVIPSQWPDRRDVADRAARTPIPMQVMQAKIGTAALAARRGSTN